jgi:putative membrane protein
LLRGICGFSAGLAARLRWRNPANMEEAAAIANWIEGVPASAPNPTDAAVRQMGELTQRLLLDGAIDRVALARAGRAALRAFHRAGLVRADRGHPGALCLFAAAAPHGACVLPQPALAGTMGWWTAALRAGVLHVLWP